MADSNASLKTSKFLYFNNDASFNEVKSIIDSSNPKSITFLPESNSIYANSHKFESPFKYGQGQNSVIQIGTNNIATGELSCALGYDCSAYGYASHAEGTATVARGLGSHAEGYGTVAQNLTEHSEGRYNLSNKKNTTYGNAGNTQHSIGIGTSDSDRKNALEVMQSGDVYLYGVGSYNGTNPQNSTDLKTTINNKADKNGSNAYGTWDINITGTSDYAINYISGGNIASELDKRIKKTISVTWSVLKSYRNNSTLIPGQQYRITDYVTYTNQDAWDDSSTNKYYRSQHHQFDIIVTALDSSHLSENAKATNHDGDTYFNKSNLSNWNLKYCLDNDSSRFDWADTTSTGRGVIYRMMDEFENDLAYDFKNIQFKRFKATAVTNQVNAGLVGKYIVSSSGMANISYDPNDYVWCYTFVYCMTDESDPAVIDRGLRFDYSLYKDTEHLVVDDMSTGIFVQKIHIGSIHVNNEIYTYREAQSLNNNVFINRYLNEWTIADESHDNTIGVWDVSKGNDVGINVSADCFRWNIIYDRCCHNRFSSCWQCNIVGNTLNLETIGGFSWNEFTESHFQYNCIGSDFKVNKIGGTSTNNVIGDNCSFNNIGIEFSRNVIGNDFQCNSIALYFINNTFGNSVIQNTFGSYINGNIFGNNIQANSFLGYNNKMSFGDYIKCNVFLVNTGNIIFVTDESSETLSSYFSGNTIGTNGYVKIVCPISDTTNVKYYNFEKGINGSKSGSVINYSVINVVRGNTYVTKVARKSNGNIVHYCEADLIAG